jgi:PST family polysaccharide transporter/lipopolysaccharide exporter
MQVLAFYGLMRSIGRTFGPIWKTIGRPDYITKLSAIRVLLIAILIYPMTDAYGILGTAITVTGIFVFPMLPLDIYITSRAIDIPVRDIVYEFVFPGLASIPMGLLVWYLGTISPFGSGLSLALLICVGAVVFVVAVLLFELLFKWNVTDNVQRIFRNLAA